MRKCLTDNRLLCATLLGQLNNVQTWFSGPQSICENRYLKSKEVWREDPSPGRIVHQGQNAVHTRESVEGSKQVNPVPVITRVLTHRLHLQQEISLHRMSACISWRNTETWCGPLLPFFNETSVHLLKYQIILGSVRLSGCDLSLISASHTKNGSFLQLPRSRAQAYSQPGHVEQELCWVFLSVWSLFPGDPAQESGFCLPLLFSTLLHFPRFWAQQRVLRKIKNIHY